MVVAVIISLYKKDDPLYYRQALDSLLSQTVGLDNIHIYQAIDGEIPRYLEEVVNEYEEFFHKVIRIAPNKGLANALNSLIRKLDDEEYVFRMDSDDIARKERFEKQICFMESHTDVGILGMGISEFYENGNCQERVYPLEHLSLVNSLHKASPFAHPTVCFRRSSLDLLKTYPTEYHLCEDIGLWFNAAVLGIKFANLQDVGVDYRIMDVFYNRRSYSKSWAELKAYIKGVYSLNGFSFKMLFPFARFFIRLLPNWVNKAIYESSLRTTILK